MAQVLISRVGGSDVLTLAGSQLEMDDAGDAYGWGLAQGGLDDWDATSDSKSDIVERDGTNGAFGIVTDDRESLPITIPAFYRGPDRPTMQAQRRRFKEIVSNGANVLIQVIDGIENTSRIVSIRHVTPSGDSGLNTCRMTFDAIAFDPLKYGPIQTATVGAPVSGGGLGWPLDFGPASPEGPGLDWGVDGTSGRILVTNNGDAPTYPLIMVAGGVGSGFTVADQTLGSSITYSAPIAPGDVVTIDQRAESAVVNGTTDRSGYITGYGFFSIPPKSSHVIQFSPLGVISGTPTLTMQWQDAWL